MSIEPASTAAWVHPLRDLRESPIEITEFACQIASQFDVGALNGVTDVPHV